MQHNDNAIKKFKKPARDRTNITANITASLRIMQKNNPDDAAGTAYILASAFSSYARGKISSLIRKPDETLAPPVIIDVEEDSKLINAELESLETKIKPLAAEKKQLDQELAELKKAEKEKDPKLVARQLKIIEEIDDMLVKKVELLPEMIREHAARRVDVFFLLMIAVYKKNVVISKGSTIKQHGTGSKDTGTAGCHASLIPNPVINDPEEPLPLPAQAGHWLLSLFKSNPTINTPGTSSLLSNTYLDDVLNMTTELPTIVNDFDGHMEGKFDRSNAVKECIAILNRVSKGILNPIDGLTEFSKVMDLFFKHMQYKYVLPAPTYTNHGVVMYPKALARVWKYESEGTFRVVNKSSLIPEWNYVYMMLGLHKLPAAQKAAGLVYSGFIEQRMLAIQSEILSAKIDGAIKPKKSGMN